LVEFIKDSDNFGLYIVEGDVGGDDWLTDHDHIKELDYDLATEGEDAIYLPYAGQIKKTPVFNITIIDFFEGAGVDVSLGEGYWIFNIQGRYGGTSEATRTTKMGNLEDLFMEHLRLDGGALYLGYRKVGEVWETFRDDDGATKYYLKGKLLLAESWRDAQHNYYNWKISFRSVW